MIPGDSHDPLAELKAALGEGNPELVAGLMDLFLEDTPGKLEIMRAASVKLDSEALCSAAHALKLSALTVEVRIMARLAAKVEELGRLGQWEGIEFLTRRIEDEFVGLCHRLHVNLEDIPFSPNRLMKIGQRKRLR